MPYFGPPAGGVALSSIGVANGVAGLDSSGLVPLSELPVNAFIGMIPGSGAPTSGVGINGDVYVDVLTGNEWGPKASGAWPSTPYFVASLLVPTGAITESFQRSSTATTSQTIAGGTLRMQAIYLRAGQLVSNLTYVSGGTAATAPTHQWAALFDASRNQLAISADATSGAWSGGTPKAFAMTSPYTVPTSGLYYTGLVVTATTVPTFTGVTTNGGLTALVPVLGGTADSSLSTPATCPAQTAAIVASSGILIYVLVT